MLTFLLLFRGHLLLGQLEVLFEHPFVEVPPEFELLDSLPREFRLQMLSTLQVSPRSVLLNDCTL